MSTNTTLVINAKGGVGKTTITTNLASYFAAQGVPTAIADYDPQGSSVNWLGQRPPHAAKIHGAECAARGGMGLQSVRRYVPPETQQIVMDAPAGPSRLLLQDLLARTKSILVPVGPSAIDIHATANFIKELLLVGRVRFRNIRLAVLANRVRNAKPIYEPLERFVGSLGISFLTRLHDSEVYIEAAETGLGIFEMPVEQAGEQQREFLPIAQWVQGDEFSQADSSQGQPLSNVVPINQARG
jgi:chromosome partitioning protein